MPPIRLPIFTYKIDHSTKMAERTKRLTGQLSLLMGALLLGACQMSTAPMTNGPVGLPLSTGQITTNAPVYQTAPIVHSQIAPIQAVVQQNHRNGVQQNITLRSKAKTPIENLIDVKYYGATASILSPSNGGEKMARTTYSPAQIQNMWQAASSSWKNVSGPHISRNSLGNFAYVTGQGTGNDKCIYAWQYKTGGGRYDLNVTYCAPNGTSQHLLNVIQGLSPAMKGHF